MRAHGWLESVTSLLLLAVGSGVLFYALGPQQWHFAVYRPDNSALFSSPSVLPLVVLLAAVPRWIAGGERGRLLAVSVSIAAFVALAQQPASALLIVATQLIFFVCDRWMPERRWATVVLSLMVLAYLLFPVALNWLRPHWFSAQLGAMALLREGFILRTVSWLVFRRVYERKDFAGIWDYLEFFFCPVFFLLPSLLNLVGYGYFHEQNTRRPLQGGARVILGWGVWGLALMGAYSWLRIHVTGAWLDPFLWSRGFHLDGWFLLGGLASFLLIVVHHTGAMSFQVALARAMGYELRYDMIFPLLARSPMELWRREHNYTRQFLLENFLRPASLLGLRRNWPKSLTLLAAAVAAYALMTAALSGWRPFEPDKTASASTGMVAFFAFTLLIPALFWATQKSQRSPRRWERILLGQEELTPLRRWRALDWAFWAATLFLIAFGKAAIGAARWWFDRVH